MRRSVLYAAAAVFAAPFSAVSAAEEPRASAAVEECPARDPVPAIGRAGSTVAVDPQTGQLRPLTAEEARRLSGAKTEAAAPVELEMVQHPDGTVSVDLKGLFLQDVVARKNPDGTLALQCVPHDREQRRLEEK